MTFATKTKVFTTGVNTNIYFYILVFVCNQPNATSMFSLKRLLVTDPSFANKVRLWYSMFVKVIKMQIRMRLKSSISYIVFGWGE